MDGSTLDGEELTILVLKLVMEARGNLDLPNRYGHGLRQ